MEWFKKHADSLAVIATIFLAMNWMNGKFNDMEEKFERRFSAIERDIHTIKTILIMKNIMPIEMAKGK